MQPSTAMNRHDGAEPSASGTGANGQSAESAPVWIHDLTVAYHRKPVLWDVNLAAPFGPTTAMSLPSGTARFTSHSTGLR